MKKVKLLLPIMFALLMFSQNVQAQFDPDSLFDAIKAEQEKMFSTFETNINKMFDDFVASNDSAFTELLKKAWTEYPLEEPVVAPVEPKPEDVPIIEPMEIENEPTPIPFEEPEEEIIVEEEKPKAPTIQKDEPEDFKKTAVNFIFYGTKIELEYDANFQTTIENPSEKEIARYWETMSKTNHYHFINQLLAYKTSLNLNDWGYYMLTKAAAEKICAQSTNAQELLVWFVLTKSRYKTRISYNNNKLYHMIASADIIYGVPYYTFSGTNYFILNNEVSAVKTYNTDYADAVSTITLKTEKPLNLAKTIVSKDVSFTYNNKTYSFTIDYNENNINFYQDFPQADIKNYLDEMTSVETKRSLLNSLKPNIENLSEYEAVNYLLRFVQTAFDYKTDPEQFGYEKFFFAEEVFHYPYSDCEDRSVIFAYLVQELLDLEVIGLAYPGHMSTAVGFTENVEGDYLMYHDKKFVISDATYINAPAGMCMPDFVNAKATVIPLRNTKAKLSKEEKIWAVANEIGAYPAGNFKNIVSDSDGNYYLAGYFSGEVDFVAAKLSAYGASDAFVAKYSPEGTCLWVQTGGSVKSDFANSITLDDAGNCYASGTFTEEFTIGNFVLQPSKGGEFVAKFSTDGKLLWANQSDFGERKDFENMIYVSKYNTKGEHIITVLHNENENFDNYGIFVDEESCIVSGTLLASSQLLITEEEYRSSANFNLAEHLKKLNDQLIAKEYDQSIAGVFAFIQTINVSGSSIKGEIIQEAFDKYNPAFKKNSPVIYANIGKIESMSNSGGIITIKTISGEDISFDALTIKNNAKLKIVNYSGGNAQVSVLSGADVGKAFIRFDLNFIKLIKKTGDLVFDYDEDHSQQTVNLRKDILK